MFDMNGIITEEGLTMIEYTKGNLLKAEADALVNTVNCIGFMGKGIALQFKQAFPNNFKAYEHACKSHEVMPGRMFISPTGAMFNPRYIINFLTKRHWRGDSRIEDIESGLKALIDEIKKLNISTIALPPLGCGNGGLDWNVVRPIIERAFAELPDVKVLLYAPQSAPDPVNMPIATARPELTIARSLFIKLMDLYSVLDYRRTLLEIQKLAYFLQEAGEPLRLKYEAGHYGPYAANLNKVLERLEGHFIRGYGDSQKPDSEIELLPGAVEEADVFLADKRDSLNRMQKVCDLIEGFETPYGMELLATVHWVAHHANVKARDKDSAISAVQQWSARKMRIFRPQHIRIAWKRLLQCGWLDLSNQQLLSDRG
jgi:O-acetyl-ADP-ribose deacetylase (regulator of RNase III)